MTAVHDRALLEPPPLDSATFTAGPAAAPRTLTEILAATTRRHPLAPAIDDGTTTLTYQTLTVAVDELRQKLAANGIGAGDRVGIRVASGTADLYVSILGVLAVGAAYVPVDADDPDERAELVFAEAGVCAVLGPELVVRGVLPSGRTGGPTPADDAWVIFTSGSTGKPKGVAVSHRSAAAFVDAEAGLFLREEPIGPDDRVLAGLSVAFDASCEEMWLAWRHGACLVPAPRWLVRTGMDLGPWLVEQEITVVSTVPTLVALWPAEALDDVRLLILGGEACPPELAARLAVDGREVWNTYGPTEATVVACAARLTGEGPVRIGLPLDGWELAVVDETGAIVPMGETGELVIGGVGLARYLDSAMDGEKYAPALDWPRAYRSGDLVRAELEGLMFLGRADEQVKLGGRRVELGEIDAALQSLPGVAGAAAAIRTTTSGTQLLVGYVVTTDAPPSTAAPTGDSAGGSNSGGDGSGGDSAGGSDTSGYRPIGNGAIGNGADDNNVIGNSLNADGATSNRQIGNRPIDNSAIGNGTNIDKAVANSSPDNYPVDNGPVSDSPTSNSPASESAVSDGVVGGAIGHGAVGGAVSNADGDGSVGNGAVGGPVGDPGGSAASGPAGNANVGGTDLPTTSLVGAFAGGAFAGGALAGSRLADGRLADGGLAGSGRADGRLAGGGLAGGALAERFDRGVALARLREALPAALVPRLAVVDTLPTRTSGKVDRSALPWPLPSEEGEDHPIELQGTQKWLSAQWSEVLGHAPTNPTADFFTAGGGSLAAARLVSLVRTAHPTVSVSDVYHHPTLEALAARLDALAGTHRPARAVIPTPRRTGILQTLLLLPLLTLTGLRWTVALSAANNILTLPWAPTVSWWLVGAGWLVLFSPPGRLAISAGGARLLLRRVRPGTHPRGGSVHMRLWTTERLAERSGATELSGSWLVHYARALGARIGTGVDLHSLPPVTGMLRLGKGSAIEPEVDLSGWWVDGDRVRIGKIRVGAGAVVGARTTLFPGTRIGKRAEIAPGSGVRGSVPTGQRWSGVPATRQGRAARRWPSHRPPRPRRWSLAYDVTSVALVLLPALAALPALYVGALIVGDAPSLTGALLAVPLATVTWLATHALLILVSVRLLGIGLRAGHHPVRGRVAWQAWTTARLMDSARVHLFPLYASLFTPVWLRALGMRVGRGVEASTVVALPAMTTIGDGAFLADDTMVATYELGGGWLRIAAARVGKRAFLGNSGMTAPGRAVPKRGLVGVLSAAPKRAKSGSSYLGMPPMKLPRAVADGDQSRTYAPPRRLVVARALVELCRVVPVMCSVALAVLVLFALSHLGFWLGALLGGVLLLGAGVLACAVAVSAKWLLVGRFRAREYPLWSRAVWLAELADTFVEVLAVPWLVGSVGGTPVMSAWLRAQGARVGRGVWCESYWLPEPDLVTLGDGATVNRGCVVQTHLFHDRILRMDRVTLADGATLGPHGIVLPGTTIGAHASIGPASLVMRGEHVPAGTRWLGNPVAAWQ